MKGRIQKIIPLSKKFHNVFRFTRRIAEVELAGGVRYSFVRHVLETGPAVSILPYFYDKESKDWHVILVRQYRPAVSAISLEAPGGLLNQGKSVKAEMARELHEEAGTRVSTRDIKVVDTHHLASSFCDQVVHLGIVCLPVESNKEFLRKLKRYHGVVSEHEFTQVISLPIQKLLTKSNLVKYTLTKYQIHDLARRLGYFSKKENKFYTDIKTA